MSGLTGVGTIGSAQDFNVRPRVSSGNRGFFFFTEKFLPLPKKDHYDAILLLGASLNHDNNTPNQDVVNSWAWNGFTKKAKSISHMLLLNASVAMSMPSSLEDVYTEIQTAVLLNDFTKDAMPDLHTEGCIAFGWRRLLLSTQTQKVWNGSTCFDCQDVQNTLEDVWMSPNQYDWSNYGLPTKRPLHFYHRSFVFGNVFGKQAYALWKIVAKVRFLAGEKSIQHGE